MSTIIESDMYVNGTLTAKQFAAPTGSVNADAIVALAGVEASKLQHQHQPVAVLTDHATDAAAGKREVLHVVRGATAQVIAFRAGCTVAATSTGTCSVDLKKNGTTMLSGTITINSGVAAFDLVTGTLSSTDLVAGDVLEAHITAASGSTLPRGIFAQAVIREDAQ